MAVYLNYMSINMTMFARLNGVMNFKSKVQIIVFV